MLLRSWGPAFAALVSGLALSACNKQPDTTTPEPATAAADKPADAGDDKESLEDPEESPYLDSSNFNDEVEKHLGELPKMEVNCQIQVLYSAFYRNKTAYIIGKAINGYHETPFAIAVRHGASGMLYLDTILLDVWRISLLFSLSRAYFLVDMEVPSGYVQFLRSIMPLVITSISGCSNGSPPAMVTTGAPQSSIALNACSGVMFFFRISPGC